MSNIGKIIRVNALPPEGEREKNVIYQVAALGAATYKDYAIDESGDMKTPTIGLQQEDLQDNLINISDPDLLTAGITTQKEYNSHTIEKLGNKVDQPSKDGNVQDYPKILGMDDNGNTAKLPTGDLGKNIANSSLTSAAGAGLTLGSNWTLNTSGLPYSITGLSDVSNDALFNTFLSQNAAGRIGKTNGKQPFLSLPSTLSEAEKTAWKTAMNGGWTTATMSVAIITPPVVDKQDKNYWISLRGANLNMPPTSFSVEIMANDGTTIIATVPNSQVQLYTNGLDLTFYYNYKNLPTGQYKIRLWNGSAYYVTSLTISVVENLQIVDFSALTWSKKIYNDAQNADTFGNGGSAIYQSNANVKTYSTDDPTIVGALKSSKINNAGENFYLEFSVNFQHAANLTSKTQYIGLMNTASNIDLLDQTVTRIKAVGIIGSSTGYRTYYLNNAVVGSAPANSGSGANETMNVVIIKNGSSITVAVTVRGTTSLSVISVPDIEYSLNMAVNNMGGPATTSLNITNLYKF
ncbi:hypothetical protein [Chryseobacterium pennipullorum]|uniref:Uncharacterized protein n=1 Tax=Chryseobacterium pennipullorum TaxID=2258963 RepID=A0A3D9B6S0_9FLAO|nr:hypothetical protein [Chryseobacterium pennipullorum]REC48842.1 hypothetical protein DRF67_04605 [Chryseobacterium pennipullorum]